MKLLGLVALASAAGLVAHHATAGVERLRKVKSARTYAPHEYVPLYPGDNSLRILGPGVQTATGVTLPPGIADLVRIRDKSVGAKGVGELNTFIRIKPLVHGKIIVRVVYPGPDPADTFHARIYRRGVVKAISAPARATLGEKVRVTFTGKDFGVAAFRRGGPRYSVKRLGGSDTSARFEVALHGCGRFHLDPSVIHDASVPNSEVVSGKAGYTGTAHATLVVRPLPGQPCPTMSGPPPQGLPFCSPKQRWNPDKRRCVPR